MKGSNVTVCLFVVQASYLRNTYQYPIGPPLIKVYIQGIAAGNATSALPAIVFLALPLIYGILVLLNHVLRYIHTYIHTYIHS